MLYNYKNGIALDPDITLSAEFWVIDSTNNIFDDYDTTNIIENNVINMNREMRISYDYCDKIKYLNLDIEYYNNCNIAIDWIRYETERARDVFWGKFDNKFILATNRFINNLKSNLKNLKIHRFYGYDEPRSERWLLHRYFNHLLDGLAITETYMGKPNKYNYCTGSKERWINEWPELHIPTYAPYIKEGMDDFSSGSIELGVMNFSGGYCGYENQFIDPSTPRIVDPNHLKDTINSCYETALLYASNWSNYDYVGFDTINSNSYEVISQNSGSAHYAEYTTVQTSFACVLYEIYYNARHQLFSENPWWPNIWVNANFAASNNIYCYMKRPHTGEELRLSTFLPIMMGAKGLIHYSGESNDSTAFRVSYSPDVNNDTIATSGFDLLYSNSFGDDYIQPSDPLYRIDTCVNPDIMRYDLLGIDSSRIYLGRKSTRVEAAKRHAWIREVEDVLMKLKLQSWYNNDYVEWYIQDPDIESDNMMNDLLDVENIRTRPIGRTKKDTTNGQEIDVPHYEIWTSSLGEQKDSSFYDITILKHESFELDNVFYLGVQNRRTDPLFLYENPDFPGQKHLKF